MSVYVSSIFTRPLPDNSETETDQDQRHAKAIPDPDDTPALYEAKPISQRKPDEPISEQIPNHWGAHVAQPAKGTGGNDLNAIEKLE